MVHVRRESLRMLNCPTHTPYDGSAKPFTIGLKPLDTAEWIERDGDFEAYLAEKQRLYASIPEKVFAAEAGTEAAQQEVLDLISRHCQTHFPKPAADGSTGLTHSGGSPLVQPLRAASLLVQEDLVLMRRGEDGWRLAAASLCFPSSWSLEEKFGRPLQDIHTPVPGFGRGTRTAEIIHRIFDNLAVSQPVERLNWSLQAGGDLYQPLSNTARIDRAQSRPSRFPEADATENAFIRVERQTLRKLPVSGDILFTIRIHLDPMPVLERHPDRAILAGSFASQLTALDTAQLDYKGLTADRDRLVECLKRMASA
jgi:dimethylamine monooxygenase subunit A